MFKNVASKIALFAFTITTGAPKTGDAANLTAYVSKDYGSVTVLADTSATEMDATNAPGWYLFDLAQGETNGDALLFTGKSSTASVSIVGQYIFTTPASFTAFVTPTNLTAAQIATGVWQDATAGDFTAALSVGKSVMNGVALGTGLTINAYTGNTVQTGDSFALVNGASGVVAIKTDTAAILVDTTEIGVAGAGLTAINLPNQTMDIVGNITGNLSGSVGSVTGAVGSVTGNVGGNVTGSVGSVVGAVGSVAGLTASNLDATITSRMATYTQPTGFLAATFPSGTVANTTNITAGTITTTTNLTNLPATAALEATLTDMKGATFAGATDSLEAIRDRGDAAWVTATGFSTLVATDIVSAGAITTSGGIASADVKKVNAITVTGTGVAGDTWGP